MTSPMLDGPFITRFAPSPTGALHLGHAFAALTAFGLAAERGGRFLLRIEDIDGMRCREAFLALIFDDLTWLGLSWETPVRRQSAQMGDYAAALRRLEAQGLTYPCFCSRKDVAECAAAPQGPAGPLYPGTCRGLPQAEREGRLASGLPFVIRLHMARALEAAPMPLSFLEFGCGPGGEMGRIPADPAAHGDIVLARKEIPASYHLCVTLDDALQGVTLVTRGEDLFAATSVHRLLQALLGLPEPAYHHHRLIRDASGRRLAKRNKDKTLQRLRDEGATPQDIRRMVGLQP